MPALAQTLAEAALQRQNFLLAPGGESTTAAGPPAPAAQGSAPAAPGSAAPLLPHPEADQVSVSPQARAQMAADLAQQGTRQAQGSGIAARPGAPFMGAAGSASIPQPGNSPGATTGLQAATPGPWPATGVTAALRALLNVAVGQLTAAAQQAQRVTAAQPWPAALLAQVDGGRAVATAPALQTWLVGQGTVQTEQGARGFTLTLQAPAAWVQAQPQTGPTPGLAAAPLALRWEGRSQGLQSGTWALVLQSSAAANAPRASALLTLELTPQLPTPLYGREMLLTRQDPWLHMAALQASGQLPRNDDAARQREEQICTTAGCPYAGRASCEQPFCLALRTVLPVHNLEPPAGA